MFVEIASMIIEFNLGKDELFSDLFYDRTGKRCLLIGRDRDKRTSNGD